MYKPISTLTPTPGHNSQPLNWPTFNCQLSPVDLPSLQANHLPNAPTSTLNSRLSTLNSRLAGQPYHNSQTYHNSQVCRATPSPMPATFQLSTLNPTHLCRPQTSCTNTHAPASPLNLSTRPKPPSHSLQPQDECLSRGVVCNPDWCPILGLAASMVDLEIVLPYRGRS
jgi:hypothetical protein